MTPERLKADHEKRVLAAFLKCVMAMPWGFISKYMKNQDWKWATLGHSPNPDDMVKAARAQFEAMGYKAGADSSSGGVVVTIGPGLEFVAIAFGQFAAGSRAMDTVKPLWSYTEFVQPLRFITPKDTK